MNLPSFADDDILVVRNLKKHFVLREGGRAGKSSLLRAVDGVSLRLRRQETLGLVGESGCGKSTFSRTLLQVYPPTAGEVWVDLGSPGAARWVNLAALRSRALREARREIQMVFQDPHASLNPRMTVGSIVAEPMEIHRTGTRAEIRRRTQELLDEVGLDPRFIKRFPHEFSGGQRQRIGIARALALNPRIIICDEPVSALDVSIRSQVLNLFLELQERRGLSYLFIAHDLSVVKRISHRVAVMYLGKIVETAPSAEIYSSPRHPYTKALLSAIPIPDPEIESSRQRIELRGEVPSPTATFPGCPFAPRCQEFVEECDRVKPNLGPEGSAHTAACLLVTDPAPRAPEAGSGG